MERQDSFAASSSGASDERAIRVRATALPPGPSLPEALKTKASITRAEITSLATGCYTFVMTDGTSRLFN